LDATSLLTAWAERGVKQANRGGCRGREDSSGVKDEVMSFTFFVK